MTTATRPKPKSITWTQVKKHIQDFSQASLLNLIHQMYNASDINKAFLTIRFQPEATLGSKELADMKKRIHRLTCPNLSWYDADPQIGEVRKIITEYKKTKDTLGKLDLMLVYVEAGNDFTQTYGDIDSQFYASVCSMLDTFAKLFRQSMEEYKPHFQERLRNLSQDSASIGWGYSDHVQEIISSLGGRKKFLLAKANGNVVFYG